MIALPRQGLMPVRQLTGRDRQKLEALAALCRKVEGMDLPLYLEPPAEDETGQFFYCQQGMLVGAAVAPSGDPVEVVGMVHPDHRRQGIGRALLRALQRECRRRGTSGLLLVCEEAAPSGSAFARAVGAEHQFSEYRMELDREAFAQRLPPHMTLELRLADARDADALVDLRTASKDITPGKARQEIVRWLGQDNQSLYIGRWQDKPIGMLRVHVDETRIFINSFTVHSAQRGRGYGRQILTRVVDQLLAEGWEQITIEVDANNAIALSLYESCGFQSVAKYLYFGLTV